MVRLTPSSRMWIAGLLLCSACTATSPATKTVTKYPGYYKVGSPYKIDDQWYHPKEDPDYDNVGMASWYGPGFHGKRTANGDYYNKQAFTAAHPTLPLPSMVRVTNLENGHSAIVMINDRGPFSKKRLIDVSERTAEVLDMKAKGSAKVRVQFLYKETQALLAQLELMPIRASTFASTTKSKPTPARWSLINNANAEEPVKKTANQQQQYFIQAGAYSLKENAMKLAEHLSQFGTVNVTSTGTSPLDKLYRVRIGPFASAEQANNLLGKVVSSGTDASVIIAIN